jgi:hypothetical protein
LGDAPVLCRCRYPRAQEGAVHEQERGAALDRSTGGCAARARQAEPVKKQEVEQKIPTLQEFAHASSIASKKTILSVHLIPMLGNKPLDQISTEDVQGLTSALAHRSPKTVNNVLAVLSVLLRTAVEWDIIPRVTCAIKPQTGGVIAG